MILPDECVRGLRLKAQSKTGPRTTFRSLLIPTLPDKHLAWNQFLSVECGCDSKQ